MKFLINLFNKSHHHKFKKIFYKSFLKENNALLIYEKEILSVAIFLYISASYLYKKQEKLAQFNWKYYLKIFANKEMNIFITCAIKYLLEENKITKNKEIIQKNIKNLKISFEEEFNFVINKKNSKNLKSIKKLDFKKFLNLIDYSLKIFDIKKNKLLQHPKYVVDLVSYSCSWKSLINEIFTYKSEYIIYNFFLNLKH